MAYDAKGQLSLAAFNDELMTRYAYDPLTYRLKRVRSERYEYVQTGNEHEYDCLSGNVRQDIVLPGTYRIRVNSNYSSYFWLG
ncbi:hypothetical protein BH09BAC1_BH09BAC1_12860 [soil metagenome]